MRLSIPISPSSDSQYFPLKNLLEEMNIKFVDTDENAKDVSFNEYQKKVLDERLRSAEKGNVKMRNESRKMFIKCFK